MTRPRGRPRSFDREEALNSALLVFWEKGLSATSLDDLASAMHMNRPSIYNAFGDKESLYRQALEAFGRGLDDGLEAAFAGAPDVRAAVLLFFRQAIDVYCGDGPARGCLIMCTAPAEASSRPDVAGDLAAVIRRIDDRLTAAIGEAVTAQALPADTDARLTAKCLQATLHSLALRARAGEAKASLRTFAAYATKQLLPLAAAPGNGA